MAAKRKQEKRTKVNLMIGLCSDGNVSVIDQDAQGSAEDAIRELRFSDDTLVKFYLVSFTLPTPAPAGEQAEKIDLGALG